MELFKKFLTVEVYVVFGLALICASLVTFMIKLEFFPINAICIIVALVGAVIVKRNIRQLT